ncbi:hypothetical protein G6M87_11045 [Rhizobium rhizogenes]|uniref:hypothetical protein n=1 Tax=Rhizobium rhizogenes TaxID=359 RepID=UPI001573A5FC|nr:hypothetical protein [Rhizobium rhizogenes]NTI22394.1 hypothetical protein [Rhizobium rhizogenes]QTG05979.1 hypothetical protein G6M87_11045 [Rhizobium rhizogenes]
MRTFTEAQTRALVAAFEKKGAWYGRTGRLMGGSWRRMCERLAADGLVHDSAPFQITFKGLEALREIRLRKFGKHGCEAFRLDLEKVTAAIQELGGI